MNTKVKKQINQLLESLRKNVPQESKVGVDQLERLFGEVRREMANIKSQLESTRQSNGSLAMKTDELKNSLGLAKRKSIETQKSLRQRKADLAILNNKFELLTFMASSVTEALLMDTGIEFETPGELLAAEDVQRLMSDNPFNFLLVMLAVIKTTTQFLNANDTSDRLKCYHFSALDLCIIFEWNNSEELVVKLDTFESVRSWALEMGIAVDLEAFTDHSTHTSVTPTDSTNNSCRSI